MSQKFKTRQSILGKWKTKVNQICVKSRVLPTTLEFIGFESIAASSDAQQEKNKKAKRPR